MGILDNNENVESRVVNNNRFTDQELEKIPEKDRQIILNFRKLFVDKPIYS